MSDPDPALPYCPKCGTYHREDEACPHAYRGPRTREESVCTVLDASGNFVERRPYCPKCKDYHGGECKI